MSEREPSVEKQIHEWVSARPSWQQDLFAATLTSPDLSDEQIDKTIGLIIGSRSDPTPLSNDALPERARTSRDALILTDVGELRDVNALADGERLCFAEHGVTCIYGGNGAGKTGYSRVLRHAGRTLHREAVLTNVAQQQSGKTPRASLGIVLDGKSSRIPLDLSQPAPGLAARICVFDAKAGYCYISGKTEVDYAPAALGSMQRLADAQHVVAEAINQQIERLEVIDVELELFAAETSARKLLESLSPDTTDAELGAIARLSEEEGREREALRVKLGEFESRQAGQLKEVALREARAIEAMDLELRRIAPFFSSQALTEAQSEVEALAAAERAVDFAAEQFDEEPIGGVGTQPWNVMWSAAHEFVAAQGLELVPRDGRDGVCALCQQGLSHDAHRRLLSFDEFVRANVSETRRQADAAVRARRERLPDVAALTKQSQTALAILGADSEGLAAEVEGWIRQARTIATAIDSREIRSVEPLAAPPDLKALSEAKREAASRHAALEQADAANALRARFDELTARERFDNKRNEIRARRDALAKGARLRRAREELATTSISRKITALTGSFVSAGLQDELNEQLRALGFAGLEVKLAQTTTAGKPRVALRLATTTGVPLTDVLSEGEQRRLALAMFLAEVSVIDSCDPVVFDDPVCSIDQEGRRHIAGALVEIGKHRQVIVFTHEMSFIRTLETKVAHHSPPVNLFAQHLQRFGTTAGHVRGSLPWEGLSAKDRVEPLRDLLAEIKSIPGEDSEHYLLKAQGFCNYLRQAFERALEDDLLAGAVRRGEPSVHPNMLKQIDLDPKVLQLMDRGIGETSALLHDRARTYVDAPPTVEELETELKVFIDLIDAIKARRKMIDKVRKKQKGDQKAAQKAMDAGRAPVAPPPPGTLAQLQLGRPGPSPSQDKESA